MQNRKKRSIQCFYWHADNIFIYYGIYYDIYQYVVAIQKNAHIYAALKDRWRELSGLRRALITDFKKFIIKDPEIFQEFTRDLILKRVDLQKLDQKEAYRLLEDLLELKKE